MTRPIEDYQRAKELLESGLSHSEAARRTGIPRSTIRGWDVNGPPTSASDAQGCNPCLHIERVAAVPAYAYLLGLYLGDGCISHQSRGVWKLRVACCSAYPGIITECVQALEAVLPNRACQVQRQGYIEVLSYSRHWPCLFPQAGPGPKHKRAIVLEGWQREIALINHPKLLLRGLIHSDGWRGTNVAVKPKERYFYARYLFSKSLR